jgi:hypothetical protein
VVYKGEIVSENYWSTSVSVSKSEGQLRDMVKRFGATQYCLLEDWDNNTVTVQFFYKNMPVEFRLRIEKLVETRLREEPWTSRKRKSKDKYIEEVHKKAKGVGMRILVHHIKAAFLAVEYGLVEFEEVFLPHFVTKTGKTLGEVLIPRLKDRLADPHRKLLTAGEE